MRFRLSQLIKELRNSKNYVLEKYNIKYIDYFKIAHLFH